MKDITLEQLLEAGCHFGHKAERWHPKAASFIWQKKDGIHIIDLAKTKAGLDAAVSLVYDIGAKGGTVLFVGSKRQARGVVREAAVAGNAAFLVQRWIGGFITNWDGVHKNIQKINKMMSDQATGGWKKFPKHEQTKLARYLERLNVDYQGVLTLSSLPNAIIVVDVRKEQAAVREARRAGIPIIGIVDTNANPEDVDYVIPANDDAVGSVQLIVTALSEAYREGREKAEKEAAVAAAKAEKPAEAKDTKPVTPEVPAAAKIEEKPVKSAGRSKKTTTNT